jgi:hypothetical protein
MKMIVYAGAFAIATIGLLSDLPAGRANEFAAEASQQTQINIGRIRSVLRLTAEQERYWPAVEAALRDIARKQAHSEPAGFVRRISNRVVSIVLNSTAIERLAVAVRPLIASLSDDQRRAASGLAQEMGLGSVVAAVN